MSQSKGKKENKPVDPNAPVESKADRFRRLATKRVTKAVKAISYIRNLANRNSYEYTDEQARKVCEALAKAHVAVVEAFAGNASMEQTFTL